MPERLILQSDGDAERNASIFGTPAPTMRELLDIRHFFPDGCYFHWSGAGNLPEVSLILFREYRASAKEEVCKGCRVRDCEVRLAPNPNL